MGVKTEAERELSKNSFSPAQGFILLLARNKLLGYFEVLEKSNKTMTI